ncbi:Na+/H+ antiporter family protein [Peptoanaerobacter stomatis]|jgi:gntP family gluconate:proton (H+) symporter|uniref:Na+/H+ antiporter family protein n=1 Tax=Peptoanaerobacter stomatis TaxID=796937 RepID=J6HHQ7_9FIRM|nr:SLC13 family permease [Peptoanaerobacter stomatis]EJU24505.1 Na+/H+ antiporter family protein [Peptoanaerobacter stomatis]NWO25931.1 sodium:proton antiporter [Peptostreptococcaceae bacterium oral taxon 081]
MLLFNPVVISVIVMCVLCLIKLNVLLAILVSAVVAGVAAGMPIYAPGADNNIIDVLISGMGGNSATALSYILLGAFAVGLAKSGLGTILSVKLSKVLSGKKFFMIFAIAVISCFSQNLVPIHIAFIPILIPPLLGLMNKLKIDRRAMACALTFGLKAPYITLPVGFGLIFHEILVKNISENGVEISISDTRSVMWIGGLSMLLGLIFCVFVLYGKDREYKDLPIMGAEDAPKDVVMTKEAWGALAGCIVTAVVSIFTESLPYSAIAGLFVMVATGCVKWKDIDEVMNGGIGMMGFIAFVMLVASGYATILRQTGAVEELVTAAAAYMQGSKMVAAFIMLMIGLLITMGIGTSFGTIPIVAAIYVPLCNHMGFSPASIILLIGIAAALGDAGSPASDSTLGPTSGLNADGQHEHIWDTCVPTFIAYDIPLVIGGVIGATILG